MLVFRMVKESNEVYKNENKEFDEAVELYRKKTKTDKRRATLFPVLFTSFICILILNPYQKIKDLRALNNLKKTVNNYYTAFADNNTSAMASMILPSVIEEAGGSEKFIRETEEVFPKLEKLIGMKINWDKFEYLGPSSFIKSKNSQLGSVITTKMPFTLNNEKGVIYGADIAISMNHGKKWYLVSGTPEGRTNLYEDYFDLYQKLDLPDTYFEIGGRRLNLP